MPKVIGIKRALTYATATGLSTCELRLVPQKFVTSVCGSFIKNVRSVLKKIFKIFFATQKIFKIKLKFVGMVIFAGIRKSLSRKSYVRRILGKVCLVKVGER